jgi:hypothetical protein
MEEGEAGKVFCRMRECTFTCVSDPCTVTVYVCCSFPKTRSRSAQNELHVGSGSREKRLVLVGAWGSHVEEFVQSNPNFLVLTYATNFVRACTEHVNRMSEPNVVKVHYFKPMTF